MSEQAAGPPSAYDRMAVSHRLVCRTCGVETTVATGEMRPEVVDLFNSYHISPHHIVEDERVGINA
jgi:hypothetical protein